MPKYERISPSILDHKGFTIDTTIRLYNGARIEIEEGCPGFHFKLKFANKDNLGWWLDRKALTELITELLYIKREVEGFFGEQKEVAPEEDDDAGIPEPELDDPDL